MPDPQIPVSIPRDLYKHEGVDFAALALQYPDFARQLKKNGQLDFSDPESVRQLTKCLLQRDFGLQIELPEDRLCPPVPNRYNYILWIQDLLDSSRDDLAENHGTDREVTGIDIGTGASCIYPLLGCRARPKWKFIATDIDPKSLAYARQNIDLNDLSSRINLISVSPTDPLIPSTILTSTPGPISFTMLNPPFYSSQSDLLTSASLKSRPPNSSCTGSTTEMIYPPSPNDPLDPGGELSFTLRLLNQSSQPDFRQKIQWFTTMLGKLSTAEHLITKIRELGCTNYAVTEFVQGHGKTRRWAVGWSWQSFRPAEKAARGTQSLGKGVLPPKTEVEFILHPEGGKTIDTIASSLTSHIDAIQGIQWSWDSKSYTGIGTSRGNVWGRKARRAAQQQKTLTSSSTAVSSSSGVVGDFTFQITLRLNIPHHHNHRASSQQLPSSELNGSSLTPTRGSEISLHIRWIKGDEYVVFESFCEMIRRKFV